MNGIMGLGNRRASQNEIMVKEQTQLLFINIEVHVYINFRYSLALK